MGDEENALPLVGEVPAQLHQAPLEARVKPGRRLVEQQQLRVADQLQRDRCALALPPGERLNPAAADVIQFHLLEHARDRRLAFLLRMTLGQAKLGGEVERLADAQQMMQRVVLRDVPDVGLAQSDVLTAHQDGSPA